ncbi:putative RING finger protein [Cocos nucifera]|nr:putative RING finger protein [Cocos nucifera]
MVRVSLGETFRVLPNSSPWASAIREEDLELRLGIGASNGYSRNSNGGANTLEDRFRNPNAWKSSKVCNYTFNFTFSCCDNDLSTWI